MMVVMSSMMTTKIYKKIHSKEIYSNIPNYWKTQTIGVFTLRKNP